MNNGFYSSDSMNENANNSNGGKVFCSHCGAECSPTSSFCTRCGAPIAPTYSDPHTPNGSAYNAGYGQGGPQYSNGNQYYQGYQNGYGYADYGNNLHNLEESNNAATKSMVFGIISLATSISLCGLGAPVWQILGLVFSNKARNLAFPGKASVKAKLGMIFSLASFGMVAFWILYFFLFGIVFLTTL